MICCAAWRERWHPKAACERARPQSGVTAPRKASSSLHMTAATPAHGTLSPRRGRPLVAPSVRWPSVSAFLTGLLPAAYRMLREATPFFSRMFMRHEHTELADDRFRENGRTAIAEPAPQNEDAELRAIEENYAVSHRVIASRVQKLLKRRKR